MARDEEDFRNPAIILFVSITRRMIEKPGKETGMAVLSVLRAYSFHEIVQVQGIVFLR